MKKTKASLLLLLPLLLISAAVQIRAQDVGIFGVIKQQTFVQDSDKIARLIDQDFQGSNNSNNEENVPLAFNLFLDLNDGGSISSATVTPPGGGTLTLTTDGDNYNFRYNAESLLDLNTVHPNGTYTFSIVTTHNGTLTVPLTLTGDSYPSVPRVSNFGAAQTINASQNFTLTWDAFSGGTSGDFIQVIIQDEFNNTVLESDGPGEGLDGTDTQFTIAANSLEAGKRYHVELMFAKLVQVDSSTVSTGVAAYTKRTLLDIKTTGTAMDFESPSLSYSKPYYGEYNVPVESVIAFHFSEPMNTEEVSIEWTGTGLNPSDFAYLWSEDARIMYAVYYHEGGLPTNTQITWVLNPLDGSSFFQDLAGNPLSFSTGNFNTSGDAATGDPEVRNILLVKNHFLKQTGVSPTDTSEYAFEVTGDLNILNSIINGTVTTPGAGMVHPENDSYGTTFDYEAIYSSKTDLDRFFPSGTYGISLEMAYNEISQVSLTFPSDNYPNSPTLASFSSLQTIDPNQAKTISWGAFTGADSSSAYFIQFRLETDTGEEVFETPSFDEEGALLGTATSVVIPAGTLSPGRKYHGELIFARRVAVDTTTFSGATFLAAFATSTVFEIQTTGSPIQPTLTITMGNPTQIFVTGDKHVSYVLEATMNFQSWYTVSYSQSTYDGTSTTFYDSDAAYFSKRFYRVKEVSGSENAHRSVSIQGTVYDSGNSNPLAGATVSTTLSGATTVTDNNGNFFLQTDVTLTDYYQSYGIMVSKGGYTTYSQNSSWGETVRNQQIYLNLNTP